MCHTDLQQRRLSVHHSPPHRPTARHTLITPRAQTTAPGTRGLNSQLQAKTHSLSKLTVEPSRRRRRGTIRSRLDATVRDLDSRHDLGEEAHSLWRQVGKLEVLLCNMSLWWLSAIVLVFTTSATHGTTLTLSPATSRNASRSWSADDTSSLVISTRSVSHASYVRAPYSDSNW